MPDTNHSGNPEARARAHAEGYLGVERVYAAAKEACATMEAARHECHVISIQRKAVDGQITDREMQVIADERAASADMSATAFDRHIKVVLHNDAELRSLRDKRDVLALQYERASADADIAKIRAKVESSRMEELGGLLRFYAAVKEARVSLPLTRPTTTSPRTQRDTATDE